MSGASRRRRKRQTGAGKRAKRLQSTDAYSQKKTRFNTNAAGAANAAESRRVTKPKKVAVGNWGVREWRALGIKPKLTSLPKGYKYRKRRKM